MAGKLSLLVVVQLGLLSCISPNTNAGMLPGRDNYDNTMWYFMWTATGEKCFGAEYMKESQLRLRSDIVKCYTNPDKMDGTGVVAPEDEPSVTEATHNVERRSVDAQTTDQKLMKEAKKDFIPFFGPNEIRGVTNDVMNIANVVSCYFNSQNLTVLANGTVDGTDFIRGVVEDPLIPEESRSFLVKSFTKCDPSSSDASESIWGEKFYNFMKIMRYFRCLQKQFIDACMNYTFKKDAANYDLSGLDGRLSDLEDVDKMKFVFMAFSNWDRTGLWDL